MTGASGFMGSHLCAFLRSRGDHVTEVDLPHCDIVDTPHLTRVLGEAEPDHIYHLAAQAGVGISWQDPVSTWRSNAWGSLSVLKAVRSACPAAKTIVMSSASVFDGARIDEPVGEDRTPAPLSPYGASKLAVESAARHYVAAYGLRVVLVRPFNVIGPGQGGGYLVPALARRIATAVRSGTERVPIGNLETFRDFLDVRDVVQGLHMLMAGGEPGDIYNLCTGVAVSVRTIVETTISLGGGRLEYFQESALVRREDVPTVVGDPGKVLALAGWRASVPLVTSLADVLAEAYAEVRLEQRLAPTASSAAAKP
ncbi:hypothetical protein AQJ58_16850 [Streptomyces sp. DSM 15324]|nr:hypothetical protein AQJ58_16850 [Streptomyces sp. DSM 15324]